MRRGERWLEPAPGGVKLGMINWIRCGINANHPVVADGHDIPSLTKEGFSGVVLAQANA